MDWSMEGGLFKSERAENTQQYEWTGYKQAERISKETKLCCQWTQQIPRAKMTTTSTDFFQFVPLHFSELSDIIYHSHLKRYLLLNLHFL